MGVVVCVGVGVGVCNWYKLHKSLSLQLLSRTQNICIYLSSFFSPFHTHIYTHTHTHTHVHTHIHIPLFCFQIDVSMCRNVTIIVYVCVCALRTQLLY